MSVIGFGPLDRIDGPLPIPPLFGLLQAAAAPTNAVEIVVDVDDRGVERWLNGVAMYPYALGLAQTWKGCGNGAGSPAAEKTTAYDGVTPEFEPTTIYLEEICTSYKVWDQDAFKLRATLALEAVKGAAVARDFMTGELLASDGQPYLADGNGSFPNGNTPTSVVDGLALLEQEIALSGKQGVIHCTPMMATSLLGKGFALADKTGVIRTINGIVVIPDFGYAQANVIDASHPVGKASPGARQEWAYATGPIDIRQTEMFVNPTTVEEALERGTAASASTGRPNSIAYFAEQYFLVSWDLEVQAAVLIDRCAANCAID